MDTEQRQPTRKTGVSVARFLPSATRVREAREALADGHYGDLDKKMGTASLPRPGARDLEAVIAEFAKLVDELDLRDSSTGGFVILLPVMVNGVSLTTPVLVDVERLELSFTSHPQLGAVAFPPEILYENPEISSRVREQLLGVLATWHNFGAAAEE